MLQQFINKMHDTQESKVILDSITDEELTEVVHLGESIQLNAPTKEIRDISLRYITVLLATGYAYKDFKIKQGLNNLLKENKT